MIRFTKKETNVHTLTPRTDDTPNTTSDAPPSPSRNTLKDSTSTSPGPGLQEETMDAASLLLMPRSLLIFQDDAYTSCLHSIDEVHCERLDETLCNLHLCCPRNSPSGPGIVDPDAAPGDPVPSTITSASVDRGLSVPVAGGVVPRGTERISLTVRRVPRVIKGLQLGGRQGR